MRKVRLQPVRAPAIFGYFCSAMIMVTTLYKYFLIGNIPWYAVQFGYIAIIGISVMWIFFTGETSRVGTSIKFTTVYLIPYVLMLLDSMLIWMLNRKSMTLIRRGVVPIAYQMLQIISIGAACMMLGEDSAWYLSIGLIAGNAAILASVLVNRGPAVGVSEMIAFYGSMGANDNLTSRGLEVHDLTFAMGELLIFYCAFGKRHSHRRLILLLAGGFFLLGWKRSAIPGVLLSCGVGIACEKMPEKKAMRLITTAGMFMILLAYLYIYVVREGIVEWLTKTYDIDMMGRNELYAWIGKYYEFKPSFMGQGIGFITEIMKEAIESHTSVLNHELSIHSDILARYIELGFVGNLLWSALTYIYTYYYIARHQSARAGALYFSLLIYCYITYFTDNTVSYYHINLALRMLPIAYTFAHQKQAQDMLTPKDAFLATRIRKPLIAGAAQETKQEGARPWRKKKNP